MTLILLVYAGQSVAAALLSCTLHETAADVAGAESHAAPAQAVDVQHDHHDSHSHHDAGRHAAHQHHAHAMANAGTMDHAAAPGSDASPQQASSPMLQHDDDCCGAIGCAMGGCSMQAAMTSLASAPGAAQPNAVAFPTPHRLPPLAFSRFRPPIVA